MTNIALQIAVERARTAALGGNAAAFAEIRRGIDAIDRENVAPQRELAMLGVVAGARLADLPAVDACMTVLRPLAPREWDVLRNWLFASPEMSIPAFAEFVHGLDREVRDDARIVPARRWTALLAVALVTSLAAVVVLALRLTPESPESVTERFVTAVIAGDGEGALAAMPRSWGALTREAARLLARHADPAAVPGTRAAWLQLGSAIAAAAADDDADRIAATLVGTGAGPKHLQQLADGIRELASGPWCDLSTWEEDAWRWRPTGDALFAYRTLVRHVPLTAWFGGWFSTTWRCDPRETPEISAHPTTASANEATVRVRVGFDHWASKLDRRERGWVPPELADRWQRWEPSLDPAQCTPESARALQDSMRNSAESLERWVRRMATQGDFSPPPSIDVTWWVP